MAEPVDPREDGRRFLRVIVGGLVQTAIERRSEIVVSSAAVAITNTAHWAWNAAEQSRIAEYWALYVVHLHHCVGQ